MIKKLLIALVCLAPTILVAQNAFDGTWHFSPQSAQFSGKPYVYSLQDGMYRCESCVPKIEAKADGNDHERKGSPYSDAVNVRAIDDHTIELISKKAGKVVGTEKDIASEDGNTLTSEWSFVTDSGEQGNGKTISKRVAPAPEGANKVSGSWKPEKMENASESVTTVTFKVTEDGLSMSDLTGDSYTAKFDGKDYPYKGDPGTTSLSLKKIDANTIEETDKREGKVISITRMRISSDGSTMTAETSDKLHGTTFKSEAKKQ